jgi:hypothetical protein
MALPDNISLITLTGQYLDFQGEPILGQVKVYPSQVLIDSAADRIIIPSVLTTDLSSGSFSIQIPITNDPDVSPTNFNYIFEESFEGGRTYSIQLPSSLGASVDISDLRADQNIIEYIQPVAYQVWPPLMTRTETQETYYAQATTPTTSTLPIPGTYQWLYLYFDTYASMASTWGTYASAVTPNIFLTNARIQQIYDRMTRLNAYTATTTDLRETTNLGVVTRTGYNSVAAKYGTYAALAIPYPNYSSLAAASFTWTYAQVGALIGNIGNALTVTDMYDLTGLTDALLSLTKTNVGNDYGALIRTGLTNGQVGDGRYANYGALAATSFSNTVRDWADRLRTAANRPHPLLTRSYQYGINL